MTRYGKYFAAVFAAAMPIGGEGVLGGGLAGAHGSSAQASDAITARAYLPAPDPR